MLALQNRSEIPRAGTVNVLPCKIHYNGPAKVTKRHWAPVTQKDGSMTSYFRGRKLKGKLLKMPSGFTGVVTKSTDRCLPQPQEPKVSGEDSDSDVQILDDEPEPVKILEMTAEFKDIVVWGHDQVPAADDTFVKGLEEWVAFADAVHGLDRP